VFSVQIFQENTFLKTKPNLSLTGKCFSLTNFPNDKQTQENLKNGYPETIFQETNTALDYRAGILSEKFIAMIVVF
jgi:hypothetical protein